jgi:hypothetical protein
MKVQSLGLVCNFPKKVGRNRLILNVTKVVKVEVVSKYVDAKENYAKVPAT